MKTEKKVEDKNTAANFHFLKTVLCNFHRRKKFSHKRRKFNFIASSLCSRASGFGFRSCYTLFSDSLKCLSPRALLQLIRVFSCILLLWCYCTPSTAFWLSHSVAHSPRSLCAQPFSRTNIFSVFPFLFGSFWDFSRSSKGELWDPHTFILFIWIIPTYIKLHFFSFLLSRSVSVSRFGSGMYIHKLFPYF